MSYFNANPTDATMTTLLSNSTIVMRNASGDRLNENNGSTVVAAVTTVTNNNTNTTAAMPIATANSFSQNNYTINSIPNALRMTGISSTGSDMCSDSEDDYDRTTRKIGTHNWIFNYEDVSKLCLSSCCCCE